MTYNPYGFVVGSTVVDKAGRRGEIVNIRFHQNKLVVSLYQVKWEPPKPFTSWVKRSQIKKA